MVFLAPDRAPKIHAYLGGGVVIDAEQVVLLGLKNRLLKVVIVIASSDGTVQLVGQREDFENLLAVGVHAAGRYHGARERGVGQRVANHGSRSVQLERL